MTGRPEDLPTPQPSPEEELRRLAHDVNTPLSVISMGLEGIAAASDDAQQVREYCELISRQGVEPLQKLVREIVDLARRQIERHA